MPQVGPVGVASAVEPVGIADFMAETVPEFTRPLLDWYRHEARVLPWRSDPTPYKVLLSEFMCQQTRIDTVIPYFHRFVERWPTLGDLATAAEEEVMREWAGLGYYARARNLLRCAKEASDHGGLPDSSVALRRLPGVGPYTAGAIASIAFGERAPLVDGNVERVLSRIDGRTEDPRSTVGKKALWARAEQLQADLPVYAHPGDFNQALMELGATVCTPRNPSCETCPVGPVCVGRSDPYAYGKRVRKQKVQVIQAVAGLCLHEGGVLLGQRPAGSLLPGLWEPVGAPLQPDDNPTEVLGEAFLLRTGLTVEVGELLGEVRHVFTHRRLTTRVYAVETLRGTVQCGEPYTDLRWPKQSGDVALSKLAQKVLALGPMRR